MYGQQAITGVPELDAVLATAQMVTPDQKTPTVAAHVAQAAVQKLMPQGIAQGMNQVRQDVQAAMPSVARNAQEAQMRQALQLAMQPKPVGIEGLPSNIRMAEGGVVGFAGPDGSFVGPSFAQNLSDAEIERLTPEQRKAYYKQMLSRRNAPTPVPPPTSSPSMSAKPGLGIAGAIAKKLGPLGLLAELFTTSDEDIALLNKAEAERNAVPDDGRPRGQENYEPIPQFTVGNAPPMSPEAQRLTRQQGPRGIASAPPPPVQRTPVAPAQPAQPAPTGIAAAIERPSIESAVQQARAALGQDNQYETRMRGIAEREEAMRRGLPDLNARGIAALEEAFRQRKEDSQRAKFNALFEGWKGNTAAYGNFKAAERQAEQENKMAILKFQEAQQARQLGELDRARALEKEVQGHKDKQDQILQNLASTAASMEGQLYGADMRSRDAALDREANRKLEEYRRQTQLMRPKEQDMVSRLEALKLIELTGGKPETATPAQKVQALESAIRGSRGTGVEEKAEFSNLRQRAKMIQDELKVRMEMDPSGKSPRVQQLQGQLDAIYKELGGSTTSDETPRLPQQAVSQLKEGVVTKFANGQQWTLRNGQPTQVK
jgi:hypothetical protein